MSLSLHVLFIGIVLNTANPKADDTGMLDLLLKFRESQESSFALILTGFGLVLICLAWSLLARPGVRSKKQMKSKHNLVSKIC